MNNLYYLLRNHAFYIILIFFILSCKNQEKQHVELDDDSSHVAVGQALKQLSERLNKSEKKILEPFASKKIFLTLSGYSGYLVLDQIKNKTEKTHDIKTIHFGLAHFWNFEVAIAAQSDAIILFDINENAIELNQRIVDVLKTCNNLDDFKQKLIKTLTSHIALKSYIFYGHTLDDNEAKIEDNNRNEFLHKILNDKYSVFTNQTDFNKLKRLAENGKIYVIHGDFTNRNIINRIVAAAHKDGYSFATIFVSNLPIWLGNNAEKQKQYLESLNSIAKKDQALIIEGKENELKLFKL
jgi:hypothetical protein